jgi:hypothetical protein
MKRHTLLTAIILAVVAFACLYLFKAYATHPGAMASTQIMQTFKLERLKNEPIAITSIKLDGRAVLPDTAFPLSAGWRERLVITIKNVSREPVTYAAVRLAQLGQTEARPGLMLIYSYGQTCDGVTPAPIEPGETAALKLGAHGGDEFDERPYTVTLNHVTFAGTAREWHDGEYVHKVGNGYQQDDPPQARYVMPRGLKLDPRMVRTAFDCLDECEGYYCDHHRTIANSEYPCSQPATCSISGAYCFTPTDDIYPFGCNSTHQCNVKDLGQVTINCEYPTCSPNSCNGSHQDHIWSSSCHLPPDTPIIVDVLGNG